MRVLMVVAVAAALASSALAAAPAKTKFGMMPRVQMVLLGHEQSLAAKTPGASAACTVTVSTTRIIQCYTRSSGAVAHVVAAFAACGGPGEDKCSARPVCTYRISVSVGVPLKTTSTGLFNVCRVGWLKRVK